MRVLEKIVWVGVFVCLLNACAQSQDAPPQAWAIAAPDVWNVRQPYANNPLQQASLAGRLQYANEKREAQVQIECRKPESARLNILFPSVGLAFNLDPFEGPPGIGQKQKLMEITIDQSPARSYTFSGYYVEADQFAFSLPLPSSDMHRLVSKAAAKELLLIRVSPADGKGSPLEFTFKLPAENAPAKMVAEPCLKDATRGLSR